eukprot:scaffold4763_cov55-Phaeocystis_antarctica.AAC.1
MWRFRGSLFRPRHKKPTPVCLTVSCACLRLSVPVPSADSSRVSVVCGMCVARPRRSVARHCLTVFHTSAGSLFRRFTKLPVASLRRGGVRLFASHCLLPSVRPFYVLSLTVSRLAFQ